MQNKTIKPTPLKPIKKVAITETLNTLLPYQSTEILYSDANPATIATTAGRIPDKTFKVTIAGREKSTLITRES